ncbi:MAG TPA: sigma-70 family RNA polymerase sigma factor [Longimicrobiales bacterium]|nr:sigma-70 family RNA polymerase sigma factor [Longimicrobiales bacterium]
MQDEPRTGSTSQPRRLHGEITELLGELRRGNEDAREPLFDGIYEELRILAHSRLRSERGDITLSTTALVHEAYLKLVPIESIEWRDRSHFFATAARAMRRILIDRARTARRQKRGGGERPVTLDEAGVSRVAEPLEMNGEALLALDEALGRLGNMSPRQLRVVELRFFAGLSIPETADALGVAVNTVKRDWSTARAWLNRELAT